MCQVIVIWFVDFVHKIDMENNLKDNSYISENKMGEILKRASLTT